jgi:thiol-disulfide isomerase/thioredoxin
MQGQRIVGSRRLPSGHVSSSRRPLRPLHATSVDPLANQKWAPGKTATIHSTEELAGYQTDGKNKLVVLMCKSSHCKPCKAFMSTYHELAERFEDSVLLDIIGDESPATKKLMVDWKVKVTPTFRIYRGPELLETVTGTGEGRLLKSLLPLLKDGEKGRDWIQKTHTSQEEDEDSDVDNE